jgi:CcmD family protein
MTPDTFPSLFWSYTAVWVIVVLYIIGLGVRVAKLERTISKSKERSCDGSSAV